MQSYASLYRYRSLSREGNDPVHSSARVLSRRTNDVDLGHDVVQFMESVAVVNSDAGCVEVDIMRIGQCKGACHCNWTTVGGSAVAGKQFVESSGIITIKDGANSASLSVPILCDKYWNATKEFRIQLEQPENCALGLYLKTLRVKIVDSNVFPTNEFKGQVCPMDENIDEFKLFLAFLELIWNQEGVRWRTCIQVGVGILHNLYEYLSLTLSVYLVDRVFNFKHDEQLLYIPGNRLLTAYVIALALFVPKLMFFLLDHADILMDLKGRLRAEMSKSLFRKFMNYSTQSKEDVPLTDMVGSFQDVAEVTQGYARGLQMLRCSGSILLSIFFTLQQNPGAWWAVLMVPCIMVIWAKLRTRKFIVASEATLAKESRLLHFSNMTLSKMPLISAYRQRPQMNELFEEKIKDLTAQTVSSRAVTLNNQSVPYLMGPTLVAFYTLVGATLVLDHSLGLGTYLATMTVFGSICDNFSKFYEIAMSIIATFPILKELTKLLNMQTDLPAMQRAAVSNAAITKQKRKAMLEGNIPRADRLEIEVIDVTFGYEEAGVPLFVNLNLSCPQGQIIALKSKSGGGRKTLLDLLGGVLYPTSGTIFIPSHLRVLMVSRELFMLELSIWANLTFGNKAGNNPYRVEEILQHFKLTPVLQNKSFQSDLAKRKSEFDNASLRSVTEEEDETEEVSAKNPIMKYSEADQALVHLVRAFVMNPEVMLLHRPFVHFHDDAIEKSIEVSLKEQRDNRGFKMKKETRQQRRPRTSIMSFDVNAHEDLADIVWEIPDERGAKAKLFRVSQRDDPLMSHSLSPKSVTDEPRSASPAAPTPQVMQNSVFEQSAIPQLDIYSNSTDANKDKAVLPDLPRDDTVTTLIEPRTLPLDMDTSASVVLPREDTAFSDRSDAAFLVRSRQSNTQGKPRACCF